MNKILKVENLSFYYRAPEYLFQNLNFSLQQGDILAILGQNGCGKSTLLDLLLNLRTPITGKIECQQHCCFVPQFFTAPFAYKVLEIVLMGRAKHIGAFSKPNAEDQRIALQALDLLGICHWANKGFSNLSGGQKQLVLIVRAIASQAPIMLLDEPTSALDLAYQNQVLTLLKQLAKERGLSIIFSTHQPNHAQLIANKTLLLKDSALFGESADVLNESNLSELFQLPILQQQIQHQDLQFPHFLPLYDVIK